MKNFNLYFSVPSALFFIVVLSACTPRGSMNEAERLIGERTAKYRNENMIIETWERKKDTLTGTRSFVNHFRSDTSVQEILKIYDDNGLKLMLTDAEEINPYTFNLVQQNDTLLAFKNESYDYPEEVRFHFTGNDSVVYKTSGEHGVIPKVAVYRFGTPEK